MLSLADLSGTIARNRTGVGELKAAAVDGSPGSQQGPCGKEKGRLAGAGIPPISEPTSPRAIARACARIRRSPSDPSRGGGSGAHYIAIGDQLASRPRFQSRRGSNARLLRTASP